MYYIFSGPVSRRISFLSKDKESLKMSENQALKNNFFFVVCGHYKGQVFQQAKISKHEHRRTDCDFFLVKHRDNSVMVHVFLP